MRVKRLEIQGFKSFKDKTVIHFDHSITGIVGPNGCGKSNIVDAFFWVMGEQSYKHMRGSSGDDLIFNGSSKYSPLGMAEATLVMESDVIDTENAPTGATVKDIPTPVRTKEISVTRRLYRSGEGEYFINGTSARLKDIHELFMDTGVGAKGYSVIEQGQIGKIVNSKPEERRLLIEEAAGIAKYKARKKESLRKMEATQANLSRLTDILQEIEKTLASLERQAHKAQLYKKHKSDLFEKEMSWGQRKATLFRAKLEASKRDRTVLEEELMILRAQLQTSDNEVEVDRIALLTETHEAERLQLKIQEFSQDLSQEKSALELSLQRQGDLESQLENLQLEKEDLESSLAENRIKLQETEVLAGEADRAFQTSSAQARQMNDALGIQRKEVDQFRSHVEKSQKEWLSGMSQISDLTSRTAALLGQAESGRVQADRLLQQTEAQTEKIENIREELQKFELTLLTTRDQQTELKAALSESSAALQTDEQNLRQLEQNKNNSHRTVTQLRSKLQSLEELNESHEGLADAPRAGLEWAKKNNKSHLVCALTDILEVQTGYETVLEGWLENRIENLFAEDSSTAFSLVEQVRHDKQGRVGIQISSPQISPTPSTHAPAFATVQALLETHGFKVLGELTQFVQHKRTHAPALNALLDRVCVVEASSPTLAFAENSDFSRLGGWGLISLDGVALEPNGVLRGGHLGASGAGGILRRKRAIEDLRVQVATAEAENQQLEEAVADAKQNLDEQRARAKQKQTEIQTLEIQLAGLERDVHQTKRALNEGLNQLEDLEMDTQEVRARVEKAVDQREGLMQQLEALSTDRSHLQEAIATAEKELAEVEARYRAQDQELQSTRLQEASIRERSVSLKRELEAVKSLITDRERRLGEIHKTLDRTSREQAQFSESESDLEGRIEDLVLLLADSREKLAAVKDKMEQLNARVNRQMASAKDSHKAIEQKTTLVNQFALETEKFSSDLAHLVSNLEEKYGPGCLDQTPAPTENAQEITAAEEQILGEEVERIRERIRRLGEVNVMAIEEHEVLKKRFDHLLTEKLDLERSIENLQEAIQHINKTSEERFKKAFEAIANRFERLFPIIFGGGQANLTLLYPEGSSDILEAGVDIHAQPPGKKVANITLLSGGEKALTAVSLIFAIFMIKPSPFCVLDEVDAPLDDANIGKFNALLKEMSAKSQFILITHNKKTMELNDTLYGVTMEEPGVSRMVSIEMH